MARPPDGIIDLDALARVGVVAFEPSIESGLLTSPEARTMPYNWAPMPDGEARLVPRQSVKDVDQEAQGRTLMQRIPCGELPAQP